MTNNLFAFRKGIAQSALPYKRSVPTWQKLTADEVKETIYKLSKKGLTPSQIGVILRDSHGVNQVRSYLTIDYRSIHSPGSKFTVNALNKKIIIFTLLLVMWI
jgi:hypothetical protein